MNIQPLRHRRDAWAHLEDLYILKFLAWGATHRQIAATISQILQYRTAEATRKRSHSLRQKYELNRTGGLLDVWKTWWTLSTLDFQNFNLTPDEENLLVSSH